MVPDNQIILKSWLEMADIRGDITKPVHPNQSFLFKIRSMFWIVLQSSIDSSNNSVKWEQIRSVSLYKVHYITIYRDDILKKSYKTKSGIITSVLPIWLTLMISST